VAFVLAVTCAVLLARFGAAGEDGDAGQHGGVPRRKDGEPSTSTAC
jgi:hypothetical protein